MMELGVIFLVCVCVCIYILFLTVIIHEKIVGIVVHTIEFHVRYSSSLFTTCILQFLWYF